MSYKPITWIMQNMINFKLIQFFKKYLITLNILTENNHFLLQNAFDKMLWTTYNIKKEKHLTFKHRGQQFSLMIKKYLIALERYSIYSSIISTQMLHLLAKILAKIVKLRIVTKFMNTLYTWCRQSLGTTSNIWLVLSGKFAGGLTRRKTYVHEIWGMPENTARIIKRIRRVYIKLWTKFGTMTVKLFISW
jgi:hypothetical protein